MSLTKSTPKKKDAPRATLKSSSTKRDLEDEFRAVADVPPFRTFVFYGRSGSGKTTLAASFPGPHLLLDVRDRGTDSVADVKGLKVFDVQTCEDFEDCYWWIKKNPKRFKTIIVDTVSQLQAIKVKEVGESKGKAGKTAGDWGTLSKRDWGDIAGWMKEQLMNYRDLSELGLNVVFIAQDRTFNFDDDEGTGDNDLGPEVGPQLSPSVAKSLNASASLVGNTYIRSREIKKRDEKTGKLSIKQKTEYCLRMGPNPVYVTKVRKPKKYRAPEFIVDPTYEAIMEIIVGEE
jgi:hypothetical protein